MLCVFSQSVACRLSQGVSSQQGAAKGDSGEQQDTLGMGEEVGPHVAYIPLIFIAVHASLASVPC